MSIRINWNQEFGDASDWPSGTINATSGPEVYELLVSAEQARQGVNSSGSPYQDSGGEVDELDAVIANCKTRLAALGHTEGDKTD